MICLIIGLPTYLHGCNNSIGGYCNRYSEKEISISDVGTYIYGTVNFENGTERKSCELLTGKAYPNTYKRREANKRNYPVGKKIDGYYDKVNGQCRTKNYASDLAIVGFVFLLYPVLFTVGCIALCIKLGICLLWTDISANSITRCKDCKECLNCYNWCNRCFDFACCNNVVPDGNVV